ncbi:MAG TPA: hypothetical protein VGC00_13505 [Thermoanaerobaculia bacterium]|jgi:hypothetical protein
MSEYDPVFPERRSGDDAAGDLAQTRQLFARASRPYLSSPVPWLAWAVLLPAAALATPRASAAASYAGVLILWSAAIVTGGAVESVYLFRARRRLGGGTPLGSWAMTLQGNLSLVAVALSAVLLATGNGRFLPGLWLLLLGHSLFGLGGLAFRPQRTAGILYQLGGVVALIPGVPELWTFAAATALGNLWVAAGLVRRGEEPRPVRT